MSKKTTSLIVGLLASAEAQANDFNFASEANTIDRLDSYAQQLSSEVPRDPSTQSILETVRRESERRQNAFSEQMREEAEQRQAERAREEAQRHRDEQEAHLTPEEVGQRRLEAKRKRDFER